MFKLILQILYLTNSGSFVRCVVQLLQYWVVLLNY